MLSDKVKNMDEATRLNHVIYDNSFLFGMSLEASKTNTVPGT